MNAERNMQKELPDMAENMYDCDHIQDMAEPKNTGELFTQKGRKGHRRRFKNNCFFFESAKARANCQGKQLAEISNGAP